eukprot:403364365
MNIPNKPTSSTYQTQSFKPGKTFAPATQSNNLAQPKPNPFDQRGQQQQQSRSLIRESGNLVTPKPQSYFQQNKSMINPGPLYPKQNLNMVSPAFSNTFAKDRAYQLNQQQKRGYSEISRSGLRDQSVYKTPYDEFDDKSTIKPAIETVVRNPTFKSLGFGHGQNPSQRINKSMNINPMNLSQTDFSKIRRDSSMFRQENLEEEFNDDDFYTARKHNLSTLPQTQQIFSQQEISHKAYSKKEINVMCESASQLLGQVADIDADPFKNDISLVNSQGLKYEYAPFQYIVTNQYRIPNQILKAMQDAKMNPSHQAYTDFGIFEDIQTAYFIFNKQLFLWSYSFGIGMDGVQIRSNIQGIPERLEFNQIVTSVQVCHPLPEMMQKLVSTDRILVVATITEIRILDTDYQIPTDNNQIYKIAQFNKNGRIFYGGQDGHINELNLKQNTFDSFISIVNPNRKRLKKNDLQKDNIISRLIPNFFKADFRKKIKDIKFDTSRNYLYSFCTSLEERSLGQAVIEVFDLGSLGNEFRKVCQINQYQIVERLLEFQNRTIMGKGYDIYEVSKEFNIVLVQPILFSQSKIFHLLVVTQNGHRIYIQFQEDVYDKVVTEEDLEKPDAVFDFLIQHRFTHRWEIVSVLELPDEESVEDHLDEAIQKGIYKVYNMTSKSQKSYLDSEGIAYDTLESTLIYSQNNNQQLEFDPDYQNIRSLCLNFIKKNESTYSHMKYIQQAGQNYQNLENYTQTQIIIDVPKMNPNQINQQNFVNDDFSYQQNEQIFEIKTMNSYQGQFSTPIYSYLSIGELERQVHLQQKRIQILTDHRVIEIQQLRPIDHLVMILHSFQKTGSDSQVDFEDFADFFPLKEVCTMLVQIVSDTTATYLFSQRVESLIGISRSKSKRNAISQPRQMRSNVGGSKSSMFQSPFVARHSIHSQMQLDQRSSLNYIKFSGQDIQKNYVVRTCTQEVRQIAFSFLVVYGDTLGIDIPYQIDQEQIYGLPISPLQFSNKHYALYQYLQRIIRPFWYIRVLYPHTQGNSKLYQLTFESLQGVKLKLAGLLAMIKQNYVQFCGQTDQYQLSEQHNQQEIQIQGNIIFDQVKLVSELSHDEQKQLETMERNSLNNLILLLNRTIESINLLDIITFENDAKMFFKLWKKLGKAQQLEFQELEFKDLVNTSHNTLIKKILEASIELDQDKDSGRTAQIIRERSIRINNLCSALFTIEENKAFVGESLISTAVKEQNQQKREELLKQAMFSLCEQPLEIDLTILAPLLVEIGNFSSLVDLTLRKISALNNLSEIQRKNIDQQEAQNMRDQCYEIILQLFSAIDISINNQTKEFGLQHISDKEKDLQKIFIRKLNQISGVERKLQILKRIMTRIEQFNDQLILTSIFNYVISKPSGKYSIDVLPYISKEAFDTICSDLMKDRYITMEKFESMVKILSKQLDAERLSHLVLNVCTQKQQIQKALIDTKGQEQIFIENLTMKQRESYLSRVEVVLNERKNEMNSDQHTKLLGDVNKAMNSVKMQLLIQKCIDNKIQGLKELVKFNNQQNRDELNEEVKLQVQELENQRVKLDQDFYDKKVLINDVIEQSKIYEAKLKFNIQEGLSLLFTQDLSKTIFNYVQDVIENYKYSYQLVLKENSNMFLNLPNKDFLRKYLIDIYQLSNLIPFKGQKQEEILKSLQIEKHLGETVFWICQYAIENLSTKIYPSELVILFVGNNQQRQNVKQDEIQFMTKCLCLFKLWTDLNSKLFPINQEIVIKKPLMNLSYSEDPKDLFVKDLSLNGLRIYEDYIIKEVEVLYNQQKIKLEKNTDQLISQVLALVKRRFTDMLIFHGISVEKLKNQQPSRVQINNPQFSVRQQQRDLSQPRFQAQEEQKLNRSFTVQQQPVLQQNVNQSASSHNQTQTFIQQQSPFRDVNVSAIPQNRDSNPPGFRIQTENRDFSLGRSNTSQAKKFNPNEPLIDLL